MPSKLIAAVRRLHRPFRRLSTAAGKNSDRQNLFFSPLLHPSAVAPPASVEIAAAVADWFKLSTAVSGSLNPIDVIYESLLSSNDDAAIDEALPRLKIRLSETLVLQTLSHRPSGVVDADLLLLRLRFFDWSGRQPYFRHTQSTYHAVFRLLSQARLVSVIFDWLRIFSSYRDDCNHGIQWNYDSAHKGLKPRFHAILVIGYAVAGKPELALQLLAKVRFNGLDLDAFSYHVLANSLVEAGDFDYADSLLLRMKAQGLFDPVTACIRFKSLCCQDRLKDAEMYLRELAAHPENNYRVVADKMMSMLVQGLCRKKQFEDAISIVDEFGSAENYGILIHQLVDARRLDAALEFFAGKKAVGDYIPLTSHYSRLITGLLRKKRLEDVYNLLVEMMEQGIAPDQATMGASLCFFCKAGMVDVAEILYNSRKELGLKLHSQVYEQLITSLCQGGNVKDVCQVLKDALMEGYFPSKKTFSMLANVLCREGRLDMMWNLLDGAIERENKPSTLVFSRYIAALFKAGEVEEASLIPQMLGKQASLSGKYKSTYINLIRAFILLRRVDVLPHLILEMQDQGHIPTQNLYRSVVCFLCQMGQFDETFKLLEDQLERKELDKRTCYNYFIGGVGNALRPDIALEVYNRMMKAGVQPTIDTSFLILMSYLKSKRIGDAISFFYQLREQQDKNVKLYNIIITGLSAAGITDQAMTFWREMRNKSLVPSHYCYEQLVLTLSSAKDYGLVVEVLQDFCKTGRSISTFLCNVLLFHTLMSQDLLRAWVRSRETTNSGVNEGTQYSTTLMIENLIALFSRGIRFKENVDKLDEVVERFFQLDIYSYNMILRTLSSAGRMDYACDLFNRIHKKGLEPNRWTFDIIVHGYCKQGIRREAERWMQAMYHSGFYPTWSTMRLYNNTN